MIQPQKSGVYWKKACRFTEVTQIFTIQSPLARVIRQERLALKPAVIYNVWLNIRPEYMLVDILIELVKNPHSRSIELSDMNMTA